MALLDQLLQPFIDRLKQAFAPFGKVFNLLGRFWNSLTSLGGKIQNLIKLILSEIDAWKNFKENINFRTRIMSLPAAIQHIEDFWQQIVSAWQSVLELVQELKGKFETTGNPTEEAEEAIADIENSGFRELIQKFPKLFKGLEKVLGFVAIVLDALESIVTAVDDLTNIVNALAAIRNQIETADAVFLQNKNKRKTVTLADGTKMRIRLGNLH